MMLSFCKQDLVGQKTHVSRVEEAGLKAIEKHVERETNACLFRVLLLHFGFRRFPPKDGIFGSQRNKNSFLKSLGEGSESID